MHFLDKLKAALFETSTPLMIKPAVALVPVTAKRIAKRKSRHMPQL